MTRIQKYKEFHTNIVKNFNLKMFDDVVSLMRSFVQQYEGTLDGIMGKELLFGWLHAEGKIYEAKAILFTLDLTGDNLVDTFILGSFSSYYYGFNDPTINLDKATDYYNRAIDLAQRVVPQDEWESIILTGWLLRTKLRITEKPEEKIDLAKKILQNAQKYPNYGETYAKMHMNDMGRFYAQAGELNQAIDLFQTIIEYSGNIDYSFMPISNLAHTYMIKSEISKAKATLELAFSKFHISNNYWLKSMPLEEEAEILNHEQHFEDLYYNLQKHLQLAKSTNNPLKIFYRYLDLLNFFLNRFQSTNERNYFDEAKKIKQILERIAITNSNDITIQRYHDYAQALIYKLGTTKQRYQAIEIYERLIEVYPHFPKYKFELIEIYWNDLEHDLDGEVKKRIDSLIKSIEKLPNMKINNLSSINSTYKIVIAKYEYYMNGKTDEALHSLYDLLSKASMYGYKLIEEKLRKEISLLEQELNWEELDPSVKSRLEKLKLNSYLERAKIALSSKV